jgi:hypothetical protein
MAKKSRSVTIRRVFTRAKRRASKMTIPLAVVAGFTPAIIRTYEASPLRGGNYATMGREVGRLMLGYDYWEGRFDAGYLRYGILPIALGWGIHKFIGGTLGVNRMLAKAKIPLLRL